MKKIERIKHFGRMIKDLFNMTFKVLTNKKTWITIILIVAFYMWGFINANYRFQNPVILRPLLIERYTKKVVKPLETPKKVVILTPTPTVRVRSEKEIIDSTKHAEVLHKIYTLESSYGKNDYCRKNGKGWGGFGVMYEGKIMCYETFEKAVIRAEYWLVQLGIDKDLATALCTWNTGTRQPNCQYYQSYISL